MAKELVKKEAQLGEYGVASVALDSEAKVKIEVKAEVDLIKELEKLAAQTGTKVDDQVVAYIKGLIQAANAIGV